MTKAKAVRRMKSQMRQEQRSQQLRRETERCGIRSRKEVSKRKRWQILFVFSDSQGKYVERVCGQRGLQKELQKVPGQAGISVGRAWREETQEGRAMV